MSLEDFLVSLCVIKSNTKKQIYLTTKILFKRKKRKSEVQKMMKPYKATHK